MARPKKYKEIVRKTDLEKVWWLYGRDLVKDYTDRLELGNSKAEALKDLTYVVKESTKYNVSVYQIENRINYLRMKNRVKAPRQSKYPKIAELEAQRFETKSHITDGKLLIKDSKGNCILPSAEIEEPCPTPNWVLIDYRQKEVSVPRFLFTIISPEKFTEAVERNIKHLMTVDDMTAEGALRRVCELISNETGIRKETILARYTNIRNAQKRKSLDSFKDHSIEETPSGELVAKIRELEEKLAETNKLVDLNNKNLDIADAELKIIKQNNSILKEQLKNLADSPVSKFIIDRVYNILTFRFPWVARIWRRK